MTAIFAPRPSRPSPDRHVSAATPVRAAPSWREPIAWLRWAFATNGPLAFTGVVFFAVLVVSLVGLVVDPTVVTGAPAWIKPMKFAISVVVYSFTLVWMLSFIRGRRRWVRFVSVGTAAALLIEIAIIVFQAARGVPSHFNLSTPFDGALYQVMAVTIIVLWAITFVAAVLLLLQRHLERAFAWSLRFGIIGALVGMLAAVPMTAQLTPAQQVAEREGRLTQAGAHSFGVEPGGPGLPVVGWSTEGGDLRVAHFVGLHALQALPFVGVLVARRRSLTGGQRVGLIVAAGVAYLALIGVLTWQALRGQSVVAPDGLTLAAFAVVFGALALATAATLRWPTRPRVA